MIKIDDKELPAVTWAAEAELKKIEPGDWVAASAATSERPVAVGIISLGRREIPPEAPALGVSLSDADNGKGARITQVLPNSGAEKAGIKVDDTIISINGKQIKSRTDLTENISKQRPGDVIKVVVNRAGKEIEMSATLGVRGAVFSSLDPRAQVQNLLLGPVSVRASAFPVVIQHDAVLRPTDCGGPLLNIDGKTIGLNIARAGRTESYAIPADIVVPLIKDLIAGKFPPVTVSVVKPAPATSIAPSTTTAPATSTAPSTQSGK
jgi:serine protease Do